MVSLKVILPNGIKIDQESDSVTLPGIDGDFCVLEGHTSFMTKIRPGVMTIEKNAKETLYAMHDGFVTVEDDLIIVVCDRMETAQEIDKARAESSLDRAKKRLRDDNKSETNFRRAEFALKRAMSRITAITE